MNHAQWAAFLDEMAHRQRFNGEQPAAGAQWKGTELCADVRCLCGADGHIDADFAYTVRCTACGRVYWLNPNIDLVELRPEEIAVLGDDKSPVPFGDEEG